MSSMERTSPNDQDAEKALLGSMLRDQLLISEVAMTIKAEEFHLHAHQRIFEVITGLADKGKQADVVTVAERLLAMGAIEDIGGPAYLAELWDAAPSGGRWKQWADIVKQNSMRRAMIRLGGKMIESAYDLGTPATDSLETAEKNILAIADANVTADTCTLTEALRDSYVRLDTRCGRNASGERHGVPTGLVDLDQLLCGFQRSELIIIAARPSVGKTAFAMQLAAYAAVNEGIPTLFVSLEQARTELADRLLCAYGNVDSYKMRRGYLNVGDQTRLMEAGEKLGKAPLFLDDSPQQGMMRISSNARRLKARKGIEIVFIDYLQLIDPDDRRANRQEQVGAISRRLKGLARELGIPVVAAAQVNRASEDRAGSRPKLSDLRESGAIEQDADTVIMLHRTEDHGDIASIDAIVAKQRNGPTGEAALRYVKKFMTFQNASL